MLCALHSGGSKKGAKKSDVRLLLLLVVIALLPLAIWACNDAGDEPDPPTGPSTIYDPLFSQPRAATPQPAGNLIAVTEKHTP